MDYSALYLRYRACIFVASSDVFSLLRQSLPGFNAYFLHYLEIYLPAIGSFIHKIYVSHHPQLRVKAYFGLKG
ncbi:hypothetical protein [Shewanella litoralis]|uniref:hypothetical protein n=1 Tax=Shewanella litoralis TaxID=2282700 RepID=UPI00135A5BF2|nr:hypothetical protein [Shewanella litoralis]